MTETLSPDYTERARLLLRLVRTAPEDTAVAMLANGLKTAFADGGIKALDMMTEGLKL